MAPCSRLIYFAERGSWDDVLQTFVNADGDATSFGKSLSSVAIVSRITDFRSILCRLDPRGGLVRARNDHDGRLRRDHSSIDPRATGHRASAHLRTTPHRPALVRARSQLLLCLGSGPAL